MQKIKILSPSNYEESKERTLSQTVPRAEMHLSDLLLKGTNEISLYTGGKNIKTRLSKGAFRDISRRLELPYKTAERLEEYFGSDNLSSILQALQKEQIESGKDPKVSVFADPQTREITRVLPRTYGSIANSTALNFFEEIMLKHKLQPIEFSVYDEGFSITTIKEDSQWKHSDIGDVIQNGVWFKNSWDNGLSVAPYTQRIICSNGMLTRDSDEAAHMTSFYTYNKNKFSNKIKELEKRNWESLSFRESVTLASRTVASIGEVEEYVNFMKSNIHSDYHDVIESYIPFGHVKWEYAKGGVDISEMDKKTRKLSNSGMTQWQLINAITNMASNEKGIPLKDTIRENLMMYGGHILTKRGYDLSSNNVFDPFNGRPGLLTEEESDRIMGNVNLN